MLKIQESSKGPYKLHPAGRKGANMLSVSHQDIFILTRKLLNVGKGSKIKDSVATKHLQCTGISSTHLTRYF